MKQAITAPSYWSPYVAGVLLGLTLLLTYLLMGFGLGASGAFAHVAAHLEGAVSPARTHTNSYLVGYLGAGRLWTQWVVLQMVGVVVGGLLAAWSAGRLGWRVEKGAKIDGGRRLVLALAGGAVVGFASRVAQGCTSGLALSGGAILSPGGWSFMMAFMVGGFAMAWAVRRTWR